MDKIMPSLLYNMQNTRYYYVLFLFFIFVDSLFFHSLFKQNRQCKLLSTNTSGTQLANQTVQLPMVKKIVKILQLWLKPACVN